MVATRVGRGKADWEDFLRFGSELPVDGKTMVIYDRKTGVPACDIPLTVVRGPSPRSAPSRPHPAVQATRMSVK
ncbi:MAG: hypothetical protein HYZ58_01795 [Acidobacteria bacterium]|nr:hypothetical protein [Acidobacteriota bacterium]